MNPSVLRSSKIIRNEWYTEKFIGQVIMQEDKVKQYPTVDGIMELIDSYSKLVEYYGAKNDLMSSYFSQKMQRLIQSQITIQTFQKKDTQQTSVEIKATIPKTPVLKGRMSYRSTKRKKHIDDIMQSTLSQFGLNTGLIAGQLNVQRIDLQQRLKAIKLRQQDNIFRLSKIRNSQLQMNGTH